VVSGGFLDAACPLVQPRALTKLLPELAAGQVTAVLSTVAAIEDARCALDALAERLELARRNEVPFSVVRTVQGSTARSRRAGWPSCCTSRAAPRSRAT
jgi:hypothetical protein